VQSSLIGAQKGGVPLLYPGRKRGRGRKGEERRKKEGGRRKEEGGRRKEEEGRRK
jgi:hypothetical protein